MTNKKKCNNCKKFNCCCKKVIDNDYLLTVFTRYAPLVTNICSKYYINLYDLEDLMQEAFITCYKSLDSYNPNLDVSFGTFFYLNLERRFCSLLREQSSYKRKANLITTPFDPFIHNSKVPVEYKINRFDIEVTYFGKLEFKNIIKNLTSFENEILSLYFNTHLTPKQIANKLNITNNKVYNTLYKVRRELSKRLYES